MITVVAVISFLMQSQQLHTKENFPTHITELILRPLQVDSFLVFGEVVSAIKMFAADFADGFVFLPVCSSLG